MESASISYLSSTIHYAISNKGNRPVICFHGYGEQCMNFSFLEKESGDNFSYIAIDLPFHGKTDWKEGYDFSVEQLQEIIDIILKENSFPAEMINQRFLLLGFSMGGRVALSLFEANPARVEKLVLLAPDGLKLNGWYWLATQTRTGNRFFAFTLRHPGWFLWFLKLLNRLGLINASIFKFVIYYIGDKEVRHLLYARWTTLRRLKPATGNIKAIIKQQKTQVRLIYGKYDRIIRPGRGERFQAGIEDICTLQVIDSGHNVLHPKNAAAIFRALLH